MQTPTPPPRSPVFLLLIPKLFDYRLIIDFCYWFRSCLSGKKLCVNVNDKYWTYIDSRCGVLEGFLLGQMLFLLYINDTLQTVDCDLFLNTDDACFLYRRKGLKRIKKEIVQNFPKKCHWFVDNKLSISFGEDKTKSFRFPNQKIKKKSVGKLDINYGDNKIKQYSMVTYLSSELNKNLPGEVMALKFINKGKWYV